MNGLDGSTQNRWRQARRWLPALLVVSLLIGTLGFWAHRVYSAGLREEVEHSLASITEEKRANVERWLADNDTNVRIFFTGASLTQQLLQEWIVDGRRNQALLSRVRARLDEVSRQRGWGGLNLYDDRGEPLMTIGDAGMQVPAERVRDILKRPRIERLDARAGADGVWRAGLLVPVGGDGRPPAGLVSVTWSLDEALQSLLMARPFQIRSAAFALVRREDDAVRFLVTTGIYRSGQRHAFSDSPRLLSALAAKGQRGVIDGALDYRGIPILGYATEVAGTPWLLLGKVDRDEAEAAHRALTGNVTLATLLALSLLYGIGFGLWRWDRQRRDALALQREQDLRREEQRSRQLLGAILEGSADAIFAKDVRGRYLLANQAHAERLGLELEQLLGHSDDELLPPGVAAMIQTVDRRVLDGESFVNIEQRLALPVGERTYLTTKAALRDANGEIIGLYGIAHDVSEHQRHEADLREAEATAARLQSELRWRDALEAAGHGVWDWHVDTGFVYFSPAWKHMLGYEQTDIGTDVSEWSSRVHPDDLAETQAAVQAHLAGQTPGYTSVHRMRCKAGGWKWILDCGAVFERDAAGKPLRMLGTHTDITPQRVAEERLRETEARVRQQWIELEAIYTTAPIGLFVLDRELRFQRLNERLAEINGLSIAAHLGRRVREILPDLAETAEPLFQWVIDRAEPLLNVQLSGETTAQPGIRRYWREQFYPMKDASGQVVGINGVVEEITEIKRIEDEIRALNADLEAKVEARTAEARAASAAKSEFLAHMSHEIRTPLNAVLGLIQALERSSLDPEQRALIGQIRGAGRSLLLLINGILDFSKIEAGQLQLDERPFALATLLGQLDGLLGAAARAKGLRFVADAAPLPDGALVGDPLRLEQVLTNLIGNAIKFTDRGEVRVSIRATETDEHSVRLRFEVADTGIGIAHEVLPRLFAPFSQADSGISRRFGGTGLGLAISKRLVECMDGEIGVESREGEGSTFWFELPFARTAEAPDTGAGGSPGESVTTGPRLSGGRYLIVDDNALNLDVLERLLELEGARAIRAVDGSEALERLRTDPSDYDAVLMDVQMPVLDGLSATRAIRGKLGLTALPVIAVTAGVLKEEQQRAREAGMDAVLPKPVDQDHLVAILNRWPRRTRVASDRASTLPIPAAPDQPAGLAPGSTAFPAIEGIDQAHVARLTRGDVVFYRRLLDGLVNEARDVSGRVRDALERGAGQEVTTDLHRLRGVAANLGAKDLVAAIRALEAPLHEARSVLPADLEKFEIQVAKLLASAGDWLARDAQASSEPKSESAAGEDVELDPTRLEALRSALASGRLRPARQLFAELRPGLSRRYGSVLVEAVAAHLSAYDFPAAFHTLDEAMSGTAAPSRER